MSFLKAKQIDTNSLNRDHVDYIHGALNHSTTLHAAYMCGNEYIFSTGYSHYLCGNSKKLAVSHDNGLRNHDVDYKKT